MRLKNRYFLLRHGNTVWTKTNLSYPWPDSDLVHLTEASRKKVHSLAKRIAKKEKIDLIYSSDLYRAKETASFFSEELGIKVHYDRRLRDTYLGSYHGKLKGEFYRDFPDPKRRFLKGPKGGENWNDVRDRVRFFLKDLEKRHRGKTILLVSHGDPLWLIEGIIKATPNQKLLNIIFVTKNFIKKGELRQM